MMLLSIVVFSMVLSLYVVLDIVFVVLVLVVGVFERISLLEMVLVVLMLIFSIMNVIMSGSMLCLWVVKVMIR